MPALGRVTARPPGRGSGEVSALVRVTARQQGRAAATVQRCVRVTVEARGSRSTQVALYVSATHWLDSWPGSRCA